MHNCKQLLILLAIILVSTCACTAPDVTHTDSTTTTASRFIEYAQQYQRFTTLEDYQNFLKTADEQKLRTIFSKKDYDGTMRFDAQNFESVLVHREYIIPNLPNGYTLESITLSSLDAPFVVLTRGSERYKVSYAMSKTRKMPGVEADDTFTKTDGSVVTVDEFSTQSVAFGGGVCYWEPYGYECSAEFSKENRQAVFDMIRELDFTLVQIEA